MTYENIHIVCCTDSNYVPHTAALLASIDDAAPDDYVVHIVGDAVPASLQDELSRSFPRIEVLWHSVVDHPALTLPPLLQISRATYLRLIIDEVLPDTVDRVLYLDVDMIVTGPLRPLWETPLDGYGCAAVEDPGIDASDFSQRFDLPAGGRYFNAGMVLLNLARIRRNGLFRACLARMLADPSRYVLADQDGLNEAFWQQWKRLDPTWNFQRKFLYDDFSFRTAVPLINGLPRIIHFTESTKPWQSAEWHPYTWLYLRFLARTPFVGKVRQSGGIGWLSWEKSRLRYLLKRPNLESTDA